MIPFAYTLRRGVRLEPDGEGAWRVVSGVPLSVLRVNTAAVLLLDRARNGASVSALAAELSLPEERCFELCESFRARGILELETAVIIRAEDAGVTVVVPTRDRAAELAECLAAVGRLEYPAARLEVVVVDDGSADPAAVARVAAAHGARLLVNERNLGPSASRNRAAAEAGGELLAFVDSDCVPDPGWLRALVPHFAWERVGAVAGRTRGCSISSALDLYEEVASPLDMGARPLVEAGGSGSFYAPTCNLLVRRATFLELGGLRDDLRLGEDVDFCWRLRDAGRVLVYEPAGEVRHKHPGRLLATLRRRADYGSSEARLHALHPERRGRLRLSPPLAATVALTAAGLVTRKPAVLAAAAAPAAWDAVRRLRRLRAGGVRVPAGQVFSSTLRGHLSALYFVSFRLVRYHLWWLAAASVVTPRARPLLAAAVLYAAGVDHATRRPRLNFPAYLGLYVAEHAAYQTGVYAGHAAAFARRRPGSAEHADGASQRSWAPPPALGEPAARPLEACVST